MSPLHRAAAKKVIFFSGPALRGGEGGNGRATKNKELFLKVFLFPIVNKTYFIFYFKVFLIGQNINTQVYTIAAKSFLQVCWNIWKKYGLWVGPLKNLSFCGFL